MLRNHVPWAILSACWAAAAFLLFVTRIYLARENSKRDKESYDSSYDAVYMTEVKEDGTKEEVKVDKVSNYSWFLYVSLIRCYTGIP